MNDGTEFCSGCDVEVSVGALAGMPSFREVHAADCVRFLALITPEETQ